MKAAKILDCTLRDGAYLIDKTFGDDVIKGVIAGLQAADIDIIEIGFLQNEGFGDGKTVFLNGADAARFVPEDKRGAMFTVLADYSRYSADNLDENNGKTFDAVRACFFKHERYDVIEFCRKIKAKGYKVFVQPVDILGYSDMEMIELIGMLNKIEPYCVSIVDTFGSMYEDDLTRVFGLIHHNLVKTSKMGFHSHNNLQMSNALSQQFIRLAAGKREAIVDTTLSGMGRGAGNTPTELVAQYMVSKLGYKYDMDVVLDVIDTYINNLRARCSWGYSTPCFIAGCYSAHVNNVSYLRQKNSIRSRDMRFILNKIGEQKRKRYDYDLLEKTYVEYLKSDIEDDETINDLKDTFAGADVLVVAPGKSNIDEAGKIETYCREKNPVVVAINFIPDTINADYLYFSNVKRYKACSMQTGFSEYKKIITSNISQETKGREQSVSFTKLIKCGWEHMDNSMILLLRLLDVLKPKSIGIAGFDGYEINKPNYARSTMEVFDVKNNEMELNEEIADMFGDYLNSRENRIPIQFVTRSRFENVLYDRR